MAATMASRSEGADAGTVAICIPGGTARIGGIAFGVGTDVICGAARMGWAGDAGGCAGEGATAPTGTGAAGTEDEITGVGAGDALAGEDTAGAGADGGVSETAGDGGGGAGAATAVEAAGGGIGLGLAAIAGGSAGWCFFSENREVTFRTIST